MGCIRNELQLQDAVFSRLRFLPYVNHRDEGLCLQNFTTLQCVNNHFQIA